MNTQFNSDIIDPGDMFLVNNGTSTSTVTWQEMKNGVDSTMLNDSDKFLVNDGTKTETVTWEQMRTTAGTQPVIGAVVLTKDNPSASQRFTAQSFTTTVTMTEEGNPSPSKGIKGWVSAAITSDVETSAITNVTGPVVTFETSKDLPYVVLNETLFSDTDTTTADFTTDLSAPNSSDAVKNPSFCFNGNTTQRGEGSAGLLFTSTELIPFNTLEIIDTNSITATQLNGEVNASGDPVYTQHIANTWVMLQDTPGVLESTFSVRTDNASFDGGFCALRVNGTDIIIDNQYPIPVSGVVEAVTYQGDASGSSINTITWSSTSGTWTVGAKAEGPERATTFKNYLDMDLSLNVLSFRVEEPAPIGFTGSDPKITFPSTIDGQFIDEILPAGTSIETQIRVNNGVGDPSVVVKASNALVPGGTTLYVDNPGDLDIYNTVKAALESIEGNARQFKSDLITRLVADGFSLVEIDSLGLIDIEDATNWSNSVGYEDGNIVTHAGEFWYALSSNYNNSPDDNDPEDWISLTP